MVSKGRELHAKAAKARESEQFVDSLTFNDGALLAYDTDNDDLGFSEGIACRSITLKVYAKLNNSKRILTLAKYEMLAAVDLARQSGNNEALPIPLYNLAQIQEELGEFSEAIKNYKEAVVNMENNPPAYHNRPAVVANMKLHLETCAYQAGDMGAIDRAMKALQDLENSEEPDKYNKDVWVSGGFMRIANALKNDQQEKAMEYMAKAKKIIDSNQDLTLRKKQWEKLSSELT